MVIDDQKKAVTDEIRNWGCYAMDERKILKLLKTLEQSGEPVGAAE